MKRSFLFSIFTFLYFAIYCQQWKNKSDEFYSYWEKQDFAALLLNGEDLLNAMRNQTGKDTAYADILYCMAYANFINKNYSNAANYAKEEQEIRKKLQGKNSNAYNNATYLLAVYYSYIPDYEPATINMVQVVDYMKGIYSPWDKNYIHYSNQLANIYFLAGSSYEAKLIYEKNYEQVKQHYTPNDSIYQVMANSISTFYSQGGFFEKSEPFFLEALKMVEKNSGGKNNADYQFYLKNLYDFYAYANWWNKAVDTYEEYLKLEDLLNGKTKKYITDLNTFGEMCLNAGFYQKAEKVYIEFEKLVEKNYGKNSADYATALNNLGVALEKQEKYNDAEKIYLKSIALKEKVFTKKSAFYALSLINISVLYDYMGKIELAEKYGKDGITIYEELGKTDDPNYATALSNLASLYVNKGNTNEAIVVLKKSIEISLKSQGENSIQFITALNNIGNVYSELNLFDEAEKAFEKANTLREKLFGPNNIELGTGILNLANLKAKTGKYNEAKLLFEKALAIQQYNSGKNSLKYANVLQSLANLDVEIGNYRQAEDNYNEALKIYKITYGTLHPEYAKILNNMAYLFYEKGDYEKSGYLFAEASKINFSAYGKEHVQNIQLLSNSANLFIATHNYKLAEENLILANAIAAKNYGTKSADYAVTLNNLATLFYELGNYERAKKYYEEALVVRKECYGEKHTEYATSLNNLGTNYLAMATAEKNENKAVELAQNAVEYFNSALQIDSVTIGMNHPTAAGHFNNLAEAYRLLNQPEKAETYYNLSIKIEKQNFGENSERLAVNYHNLSLLFAGQKKFSEAENYAIQSRDLFEKKFGKNCPAEISVTSSLAYIYEEQNKINEAATQYKKAVEIQRREIENNFAFLSESEKSKYLDALLLYNNMYLDFAINKGKSVDGIVEDIYYNEIYYKGILLRSSNKVKEYVLSSKDSVLIKLYEGWIDEKEKLAAVYSGKLKYSEEEIYAMEEAVNSTEKKLVEKSTGLKNNLISNKDNYQKVSNKLKTGQAALEFLSYKGKEDQKSKICAIVIKPKQKPILIEINEEDKIVELIGKYGANTFAHIAKVYGSNAKKNNALYSMVWKPLESYLLGTTEIFYAPSGALHKISFSAVANNNGQYLSDIFVLHKINETTAIINSNDASVDIESYRDKKAHLLVMGGVNYDTQDSKEHVWDYLPGTKSESEKINAITAKAGINSIAYFGDEATEEHLKENSNANSTELIHIATHGFFYNDQQKVIQELEVKTGDVNFRGNSKGISKLIENPNPLMRSGIVLAGANDIWTNTTGSTNDGVLTAYEVSLLNLEHTKLAVLSACETGLGDIKGNEGVYGLQRSFKTAGVKFMIMSLWKVPDKETEEFMVNFYTNLYKCKNIEKAFFETQNKMKIKYDPYYWAAFVLNE